MTKVNIQLDDCEGGRVAWVTMDNERRLNAGSLELVKRLKLGPLITYQNQLMQMTLKMHF